MGECFKFEYFQWHVGMCMFVVSVGALISALITLNWLGQCLCADCGSGDRVVGLFLYVLIIASKYKGCGGCKQGINSKM